MNQLVTKDDFMTSLRYLIVGSGSWAVGKGYITSQTLQDIIEVATVVGPLVWGLYASRQQKKVAAAVGVQAGINMTAQGQAVDGNGNVISKFAPDATPPKPVTQQTAPEIVAKFGPSPSTIAKS